MWFFNEIFFLNEIVFFMSKTEQQLDSHRPTTCRPLLIKEGCPRTPFKRNPLVDKPDRSNGSFNYGKRISHHYFVFKTGFTDMFMDCCVLFPFGFFCFKTFKCMGRAVEGPVKQKEDFCVSWSSFRAKRDIGPMRKLIEKQVLFVGSFKMNLSLLALS